MKKLAEAPTEPRKPRKPRRRPKGELPAPETEAIPSRESTQDLVPESLTPEPLAEASEPPTTAPPPESPAAVPDPPGQDAAMAEAERLLVEKYGNTVNIVFGSLKAAGGRPEFGLCKRTVIIRCAACNKERVLATSDLFHVAHCAECNKSAKKAARKKES
jgi:hypothetical protein